jgi:hypothetical protein
LLIYFTRINKRKMLHKHSCIPKEKKKKNMYETDWWSWLTSVIVRNSLWFVFPLTKSIDSSYQLFIFRYIDICLICGGSSSLRSPTVEDDNDGGTSSVRPRCRLPPPEGHSDNYGLASYFFRIKYEHTWEFSNMESLDIADWAQ